MAKLHTYGILPGQALPGKFRGYKLKGEKLRPRYPADYAMTGAKNALDLRRKLGAEAHHFGHPAPTRKVPQRYEKLAMAFYDNPRYDRKAFLVLPRPARRLLNQVWAAEGEAISDKMLRNAY
jgi:hypothetical protein